MGAEKACTQQSGSNDNEAVIICYESWNGGELVELGRYLGQTSAERACTQ
jgi:hypothetical protein